MTIKEMHIGFDQGVQIVSSNRSRSFYPEEKDLILNKIINRYIATRVRPKPDGSFEVDSVALEQIKSLLANSSLPAEIIGNNYQAILPSDLGWFISAGAYTKDVSCQSAVTPTSTVTEYIHKILLPLSSKETTKYYVTASLMGTAATALNSSWLGVPTKEQWFSVYPHLIGYLRRAGEEIYVGKDPFTLKGNINDRHVYVRKSTNTNLTAVADATTENSVVTTRTYTVYQDNTTQLNPVRLNKSSLAFNLQSSPYWDSSYLSPLASLLNHRLEIIGKPSYIVTGVGVIYLRKPSTVNVSLGISCDLPEEYHGDIVDLAVAYTKGELNSPDWEQKMADLKLNTTAV